MHADLQDGPCGTNDHTLPLQVLLRWGIERGCSVVPKSTNHHHQKVNMDILSWSLTKEQYETLSSLKSQVPLPFALCI